jgi:hypothetical protein
MKTSYYFSHDYNARQDIKIRRMIIKHGMTAYGIWWAIIEDLYNNANALETDYECIAIDLRVDIELVKAVINDFDLFVIKDGYFGSMSVQNRIDERNLRSKKAADSANVRWSKDANALQPQSESNAIKERKGKEKKEKESILDFDLFYLPYPKKKAKGDAEKAWKKLTDEERQMAIDALPNHVKHWEYKNEPQFIPHPSTWLNSKRWEDVLDESQTTAGLRLKPEFRNYQYWDDNTNGEKENIVYFTFKHPMNGDWLNIKGRKEQYEMLLNQYGAHCVKSCHE